MNARAFPLDNRVQNYAWGSTRAIAEFLGRPSPEGLPEAELWVGAHPKAPSRLPADLRPEGLDELIRLDPAGMLGESVAARYGELPFLLKVLAAAEPLSIQCHPDPRRAKAGFERENAAGIPLIDPRRNYRDANHKPELLVALTPFHALKGFRPVDEILVHRETFLVDDLRAPFLSLERERNAAAVKALFGALLSLEGGARARLVERVQSIAREQDAASRWVSRLGERYRDDVGVLAPLLLNLVALKPGEGLFLDAGELHAYLEGTGLEIMANSDNVLRGGLTAKHVDVDELLATAIFEPEPAQILHPEAASGGELVYRTPASEFELSLLDVTRKAPFVSPPGRGVELLLGLTGRAILVAEGRDLPLHQGRSVFVPAALSAYRIEGEGRICRAKVGRD